MTGQRAFERETAPQTLAAIIEAEPELGSRLDDRVPEPLAGLIGRCLAKDPSGRYGSTGELASTLATAFAGRGVADDGIYFVDRDTSHEDARWVISLLDFAGGQVRALAPLPHPPELRGPAFSVSPDGRFVLSPRVEEESDLMLVENVR